MTQSRDTWVVTGGAGFIGCNYVRWLLDGDPAVRVVVLDALTYAGHRASLREVEDRHYGRFEFVHGDIRDAATVRRALTEHAVDTIVHFAAESHVDRSIDAPAAFIDTNINGTHRLLEAAAAKKGTACGDSFLYVRPTRIAARQRRTCTAEIHVMRPGLRVRTSWRIRPRDSP